MSFHSAATLLSPCRPLPLPSFNGKLHNEQEWWWNKPPGGLVGLSGLVQPIRGRPCWRHYGGQHISNWTQSLSALSYSILSAISSPQPRPFSPESEWVDYWLSWDPPHHLHHHHHPLFIFLALTFIETFQRNTPPAIHFLKWSYGGKKKKGSWRGCLYARVIYKWAGRSFIFLGVFFFFLLLPVTVSVPRVCSVNLNLFVLFILSSQLLFYIPPHFFPSPLLTLIHLSPLLAHSPTPAAPSGTLYSLLNQYSSLVCKNCRTTRPDITLYSFIHEKVSSGVCGDAADSARDSGMSPGTSNSH